MESWQPLHGGLFKHQIEGEELQVEYLSLAGMYYFKGLEINQLAGYNSKQFNPHLDTTNEVIKDTLVACFKRCSEEELEVKKLEVEEGIEDIPPCPEHLRMHDYGKITRLKVKTMFFEMKFCWQIDIPETSDNFQQGVLNPFLNTIQLLLKQQKLLEKTLKKKDAEISEFRSLGVKLSKKSVLSPPYDPKTITMLRLDSRQSLTASLADPEVKEVFRRASVRKERVEKAKSGKNKVVKMGVRFSDDESEEEDEKKIQKEEPSKFKAKKRKKRSL